MLLAFVSSSVKKVGKNLDSVLKMSSEKHVEAGKGKGSGLGHKGRDSQCPRKVNRAGLGRVIHFSQESRDHQRSP